MAFEFSDRHIETYQTRGYTVFEQILPATLIADLRRVTDQAREMARDEGGAQAQRLQPIANYDLEAQPFRDYADLPELVDALSRVLTPRHRHGDLEYLGVLFEPRDLPWATHWHRDWRDNVAGLPLDKWDEVFADIDYFNQINSALYEDSSTWVVPGSHLRRDLPREIERFPDRPVPGPEVDGKTYEERERTCLTYCQSMPDAVQLHLEAGDFALYRNTLWHIGNYVPHKKRATLHDGPKTPEFIRFIEQAREISVKRREAGHGMENPNA